MQALSTPTDSAVRRARVDVRFTANWEVIDDTRTFLMQALAHAVPNATRLEQIGIAAHELMENAFRYSPAAEVVILVEVEDGDIRIVAENDSTPERIADLSDQVRELTSAIDPLEHYRKKMLEVIDRVEGSGLGLARIRWEAGMTVDFQVEGSRVRVRACGRVPT